MASIRDRRRKTEWLTPAAVAEQLDVDERTVREWFYEGRFPNAWISETRRIWIPVGDLAGWRVARN